VCARPCGRGRGTFGRGRAREQRARSTAAGWVAPPCSPRDGVTRGLRRFSILASARSTWSMELSTPAAAREVRTHARSGHVGQRAGTGAGLAGRHALAPREAARMQVHGQDASVRWASACVRAGGRAGVRAHGRTGEVGGRGGRFGWRHRCAASVRSGAGAPPHERKCAGTHCRAPPRCPRRGGRSRRRRLAVRGRTWLECDTTGTRSRARRDKDRDRNRDEKVTTRVHRRQ
jgi:hypothetical protein